MNKYNLPLQLRYSTTKEEHPDWESDVPQEILLGYRWDKILDELIPNLEITHGNKGRGLKGELLKEKPFTLEDMSKRKLLLILSSLYDPLGIFSAP